MSNHDCVDVLKKMMRDREMLESAVAADIEDDPSAAGFLTEVSMEVEALRMAILKMGGDFNERS